MKQKLTKFIQLIRNDKQSIILIIVVILILFIFTLGYSLSMFNENNIKEIANIKVNGLSFNMTTNSGEPDDRILHLKAGKTEKFDVILTNLNKSNVKYELIYELCNNSSCSSTSKSIPSTIIVGKEKESTEINGTISNNKKEITIITNNKSSKDYYIKLNISAGYEWNDLALTNQIQEILGESTTKIIAYVDGKEVNYLPTSCAYSAEVKAYENDNLLTADKMFLSCNYYTKKWSVNLDEMDNLPNKLEFYFKTVDVPEDALCTSFDYVAPTTGVTEPYSTYKVPATGTYFLEVWGAQGGGKSNTGYGGYSSAYINLNKDDILYVVVGGKGSGVSVSATTGGYNGGINGKGNRTSDGSEHKAGSGGGATHIALSAGVLETLKTNVKDDILIVAGGGGAMHGSKLGGSGGGYIGVAPKSGSCSYCGSSGGGGGYSRGAKGQPAAGGTGYIGSSKLLANKRFMYCYDCQESNEDTTYTINAKSNNVLADKVNCPNGFSATAVSKCAKSGHGYARITYVNDNSQL